MFKRDQTRPTCAPLPDSQNSAEPARMELFFLQYPALQTMPGPEFPGRFRQSFRVKHIPRGIRNFARFVHRLSNRLRQRNGLAHGLDIVPGNKQHHFGQRLGL